MFGSYVSGHSGLLSNISSICSRISFDRTISEALMFSVIYSGLDAPKIVADISGLLRTHVSAS
ncbi:hypothetical protein ES705_17732 [subsurface metagenome]